jgi:trehalose 6-phosphate phosphatase
MNEAQIVARASTARRLLIATDFDGTISEITTTPGTARARQDAMLALDALARAENVDVALVSGRMLESLLRLTEALPPVWRVAEHGAFITTPGRDGEPPVLTTPQVDTVSLDNLEQLLRTIAERFPGMRIERKIMSVSAHTRAVDPEAHGDALAALAASFVPSAAALGLEMMSGKEVLEAHSPWCSKHSALTRILEGFPADTLFIYAGDDTTDEGTIALAHARGGVGIYIASDERPTSAVEPDLTLPNPRAWAELLTAIAAQRRPDAEPPG